LLATLGDKKSSSLLKPHFHFMFAGWIASPYILDLDVRNIFAGSHTELRWGCSNHLVPHLQKESVCLSVSSSFTLWRISQKAKENQPIFSSRSIVIFLL
jgi:hypothetical protein